MTHFLSADNLGLGIKRSRYLKVFEFKHVFVNSTISDINLSGDQTFYFPLYLYPDKPNGHLFKDREQKRIPNFIDEFSEAIRDSLITEPTQEEIFYYIYAVLYSPIYRERYKEFLKIDFPRVPLPSDYEIFKELSKSGKELVDLHLLKSPALDETEIGFPRGDSNNVEKVSYDEENQRVFINKEQYFEGVSKEVWEYRIGAYQVMEKYLKDRKKRRLSLDEINHYMAVAKAIRLTIELQEKIDDVYRKIKV